MQTSCILLTSFWRSVRFVTEIKRPPPPFPPPLLHPPLWRDDDARSSRRDAPSFIIFFFFPKRATPFASSPKGKEEEEEKELYQDEDDEGVSPGASAGRRRNRRRGFEILFRRRHRMFCEPLLIGAFGRHQNESTAEPGVEFEYERGGTGANHRQRRRRDDVNSRIRGHVFWIFDTRWV